MKKLELKISEIKEVCDKKREIHNKMLNAGLENIDFIDDNGNIVEIEKQNIDDYKYTGLNLIDFIDSDFYKNGFENLNSKRYIAKCL